MANHKSALKRARQSETRRALNRVNKTKVKNAVKVARTAISECAEGAADALKNAMIALTTAASKGTIHRRNASRRIARLSKQLSATCKASA